MVFDGRYCSALRTVGGMVAVVPLEEAAESEPEDVVVALSLDPLSSGSRGRCNVIKSKISVHRSVSFLAERRRFNSSFNRLCGCNG